MALPPLFNCHFPTFVKDNFNHKIDIFWYEQDFTQSRYPPGQGISQACTLICLLVAQRICQTKLIIEKVENCPKFNVIMAEAMMEGNATHAWILRNRLTPQHCLSVEEAMKYGGRCLSILKEWTFHLFKENIEDGLCQNIKRFLRNWFRAPKSKNLFMLLITSGRTVLFIFQGLTNKVTFFDSHNHSTIENPNRGLVVAQAGIDQLDYLCYWYIKDILNSCYDTEANKYELAFLYEQGSRHCTYSPSSGCGNYIKQ